MGSQALHPLIQPISKEMGECGLSRTLTSLSVQLCLCLGHHQSLGANPLLGGVIPATLPSRPQSSPRNKDPVPLASLWH